VKKAGRALSKGAQQGRDADGALSDHQQRNAGHARHADQDGRRLVDNARVFALYQDDGRRPGVAMSDASCTTASGVRSLPSATPTRTAIRRPTPIPNWLPLMQTPNHGEYPCGHCTYAGGGRGADERLGGASPAWGVRIGPMSLPNSRGAGPARLERVGDAR
jgi:hypothetical protein